MLIDLWDFLMILLFAAAAAFLQFLCPSALECLPPSLFLFIASFASLAVHLARALSAHSASLRPDVAQYFSALGRSARYSLLSGVAFRAIPNWLIVRSFLVFPVCAVQALLTLSACVGFLNQFMLRIPFDTEALTAMGSIGLAVLFSFSPEFVASSLKGGYFLAHFLPLVSVVAAAFLLGIGRFYRRRTPLDDAVEAFAQCLFQGCAAVLVDGVTAIEAAVELAGWRAWAVALLYGSLVIGLFEVGQAGAGGDSVGPDAFRLANAFFGVFLGTFVFWERTIRSLLEFLLAGAVVGIELLAILLVTRIGFPNYRAAVTRDRRDYARQPSS
jgi:hypothetical protein